MTFIIIDENTVEAAGVIGVFVEAESVEIAFLRVAFWSHAKMQTALTRLGMEITSAKPLTKAVHHEQRLGSGIT